MEAATRRGCLIHPFIHPSIPGMSSTVASPMSTIASSSGGRKSTSFTPELQSMMHKGCIILPRFCWTDAEVCLPWYMAVSLEDLL
ncbi:transcription initiation protein SPT3 [Grus japonensis]|uniref:Transcription initiation protein SPT3 n=1 Tax=Grus japonensis TaxID=30415 RepID=A0ABC9WJE8_GRUJA